MYKLHCHCRGTSRTPSATTTASRPGAPPRAAGRLATAPLPTPSRRTAAIPDKLGDDINITSANYYGPHFFPDNTINESTSISPTSSELITLPSSSTAVGLLISTFDQKTYTYTLSNGEAYTDPSPPSFGNFAFLGFTDTHPPPTNVHAAGDRRPGMLGRCRHGFEGCRR
jgi:hypothetical protein